jgi:hypothetical protein
MKCCPLKLAVPAFMVIFWLALSPAYLGCNAMAAETQSPKRLETFSINQGTFVVTGDSIPTIDVKNHATIYTLTANNTLVEFTKDDDTAVSLRLNTGDMLIEWPESGQLTMVRSNPQK